MQTLLPLLWIIFLVSALLYAIYGIILSYHWVKWSDSVAVTSFAILVYSSVGVVLFGMMLSTLVAISL